MSALTTRWIHLEGGVNVRDVGGLPTVAGGTITPGALIRSASLQHLTPADVRLLVDELKVRRVVDLRTDLEVRGEGPGPLHDHAEVLIQNLSLYPDTAAEVDPAVPNPVLPWQTERPAGDRPPMIASYLRYLERRPDSLVAALRAIAEPDGATLVHCAAGKDRTGMVVALALTVAGVPRDVIAADYGLTQTQILEILRHLSRSTFYNREVTDPDKVPPALAEAMATVLDAVDEDYGGVLAWLARQGWTEQDTQRLQAKLTG